jgi:Domain of unknown function (DUF4329)
MPAILGSFDDIYRDLLPDAGDLSPDAGRAPGPENSGPTYQNSFEDVYGGLLQNNAGEVPGPGNSSPAPGPGDSGPTSKNSFEDVYGGLLQNNAGGARGYAPAQPRPLAAGTMSQSPPGSQPSVPTSSQLFPPQTTQPIHAPIARSPIARSPVSRGAGSGSGDNAIKRALQPAMPWSLKRDTHYNHDKKLEVRRTSPFRTQDDAARRAIGSIANQSIRENRGYGGLLYFRPSQGTYGYTHPTKMDSTVDSKSFPSHRLPPDTELAGDFQTNGAYSQRARPTDVIVHTDRSGDAFYRDKFTLEDLRKSNEVARGIGEYEEISRYRREFGGLPTNGRLRFYLGTPGGDIRVHDPLDNATRGKAKDPVSERILVDHGTDVVLSKK